MRSASTLDQSDSFNIIQSYNFSYSHIILRITVILDFFHHLMLKRTTQCFENCPCLQEKTSNTKQTVLLDLSFGCNFVFSFINYKMMAKSTNPVVLNS
jgi:hypothetical protein